MSTKSRSSLKLFTLCLLLTLLLAVGFLPDTSLAAENFSDLEGHWAEENINTWVDTGLVKGYNDGTFKPNDNISRAEFVVLINRAFGFIEKAPAAFTDVPAGSWYYNDVAIASKAGYIAGYSDQTMKPNNPISRQEVAAILARLLDLEGLYEGSNTGHFRDFSSIPEWSRASINAVVSKGYMGGYPDGTFAPGKLTTRAEAVAILSRAVGELYKEAGVYGPAAGKATITKNVTVAAAGVRLQNTDIKGDLFLTPGIGDGDVYLKNVTVEGRTIVAGGGEESVIFEDTVLETVIMRKEDGKVRIVLEGGSSAASVTVKSGGRIEITGADGSIATIEIESDEEIEIEGNVGVLTIEKENAKVNITGGTVNSLIIEEEATGATVSGQGNIVVAVVSTTATIEIEPEETHVQQGVTASIAGQEVVGDKTEEEIQEVKETITVPEPQVPAGPALPPSGGGGDSGDSGDTSDVPVSAVSVDPDIMLLTVGDSDTIAVTVSPSNATNRGITWSSSDDSIATVDADGRVTGVAGGTATITVTSVADSTKKATKRVVVGDLLVPAHGSIQGVINVAENGDVIAVAPGRYEEQLVINKPMTLLGPNAAIAGTGNRDSEAVITYPDNITQHDSGEFAPLIDISTDGATISGFTLSDGGKSSDSQNTTGINAHGNNIKIKNNVLEGFNYVQVLVTSKFWENGKWNRYTEYCEDILVEGNYGKDALDYTSIYLQGASGVVKNNKVENAPRGIQIQQYGNPNGGTVEDNEVNAYWTGIWYNYAQKGAGSWTIKNNNITASAAPSAHPYGGAWAGLEVQTFGSSGQGNAPEVTFMNNTINGAGATIATRGLSMTPSISDDAIATFTGNTFINVEVGAYRGAGTLDLETVLADNTFPEGSRVIGNEIKVFVPEENTIYNMNTGAEYNSIQTAIDQASPDDIILAGPGVYYEAIEINKSLTLLGAQFGVDARNRSGAESVIDPDDANGGKDKSWVVWVKASDVTIDGFTIQNPKLLYGSAGLVSVQGAWDNLRFRNNILQSPGVSTQHSTDWGKFGFNIGEASNVVVEYNYIRDIHCNTATPWNGSAAIWPWSVNGLEIRSNKIENVTVFGVGLSGGNSNVVITDNDVSLGDLPENAQPDATRAGIRVGGGNDNVQIIENRVFDCRHTETTAGIRLQNEAGDTTPTIVRDNTVENCVIGITTHVGSTTTKNVIVEDNILRSNDTQVYDPAGALDLYEVLNKNEFFPDGSQVIGNKIKVFVPEENKVYNMNTGAEYDTIQAAVTAAQEGDTIVVGPGQYDVTYVDGATKHYLLVNKTVTIMAADNNNKPVLTADYSKVQGQSGHQQATVHIVADNVTLDGLDISSISGYPGWIKVVEITDANNVTVKNCKIQGADGVAQDETTAIYLGGQGVGKYTIEDNLLDGAIVIANGAGNGEGGDSSVIKGNTIYASISFTGETTSGWDHYSIESYPSIEDNEINGTSYGMLINSRDLSEGKLISDQVLHLIMERNEFPDGTVGIVRDSYEYFGSETYRKRIMLNPGDHPVYNEDQKEFYKDIKTAVANTGEGDTILITSGTYNLTESLSLGKPITIMGAGKENTIIDVTGISSVYAFPLGGNADLSVKDITFKGKNDLIGFRASSQTHVEKLELINCVFEDFKYPMYLAERYGDDATDAENKVGTLILEGNDFVNVAETAHAAYIGRGVVNYASIRDNSVTGSRRGFQIFDCRGEVGDSVPRTTGQVTIANNTFTGFVEWPIDLMIGGPAIITGNNVVSDLDEVPVIVLRDTDSSLVQDYSGNKVNGIEVSLEQKDFEHESSGHRNLWLYYHSAASPMTMGLTGFFMEEELPADDEEEPEGLDLTPLENAIQEAIAAKEGIAVCADGQDVPAGTYWVTQEDMDALDAAIAKAEAAKGTVETQQDVTDAVEELEAAVSIFNEARQEAISEEGEEAEEGAAEEETEGPINEEEVEDD